MDEGCIDYVKVFYQNSSDILIDEAKDVEVSDAIGVADAKELWGGTS